METWPLLYPLIAFIVAWYASRVCRQVSETSVIAGCSISNYPRVRNKTEGFLPKGQVQLHKGTVKQNANYQ